MYVGQSVLVGIQLRSEGFCCSVVTACMLCLQQQEHVDEGEDGKLLLTSVASSPYHVYVCVSYPTYLPCDMYTAGFGFQHVANMVKTISFYSSFAEVNSQGQRI